MLFDRGEEGGLESRGEEARFSLSSLTRVVFWGIMDV